MYDIAIIGGGINGCGIARDAAGRGYSVCLFEMNDLASGTSSWSSKLIHGGLRYLEHFEFRLVREALGEREVLLKSAPHIIRPMRFVLPHHDAMRPAWLLRLGLFLYDHIGKRKLLPPAKSIDLRKSDTGKPLQDSYAKGIEYSDCWVDDARLVVLNAMDAAAFGANIETRTKVESVRRDGDNWRLTTRDQLSGQVRKHTARAIVNAAGPWVDDVLGNAFSSNRASNIRLVQGSHIVVPRMFEHDRAYIFQNADDRVIFVIPYERDFSLIGTTDQDYSGNPGDVKITPAETVYLCEAVSGYFKKTVHAEDIVWSYSGVRPLYDDGASAAQEATRDYVLRVDGDPDGPPLINIFGGKITTYRRLAESMLAEIEAAIGGKRPAWTDGAQLPGGDFPVSGLDAVVDGLATDAPELPRAMLERLVRAYGTRAKLILNGRTTLESLDRHFGADLYECEAAYLIDCEWARTADDILWRRSKLGLRFSDDETGALEQWIAAGRPAASVSAAE